MRIILIAVAATQLARAASPQIVMGNNSSAEAREAASELAHYVAKATGEQLSITDSAPASAIRILVGPSACPPEVRKQLSRLRGDGYVIQSLPGGSLALAGNGRDGTSFAVYRFLERSLGIRKPYQLRDLVQILRKASCS